MQMTGRSQVSVPKAISQTETLTSSSLNAAVIFSTGDSLLTANVAATTSTSDIDFPVGQLAGFTDGQTVIVGYGTENEETFIVGTQTEASASGNLKLKGPVTKAHKKNERVLRVVGKSLVPGTVVLKDDASTITATDNKDGTLTGAGLTGTGRVDYATGAISVTLASTPTDASVVTYIADVIPDSPDIADVSGNSFFKNFPSLEQNRQAIPDSFTISNLGKATCGVFIEVSRNNGRSFTTNGCTSVAANTVTNAGQVTGFGRLNLNAPGGYGGAIDAIRIRGGMLSTTDLSTQPDASDPNERIVRTGTLECDFRTQINDNGQ